MTQNADVEWLRHSREQWPVVDPERGQRLLAHIDQLEAANNWMLGFVDHLESKLADQQPGCAPSVDEIAVHMMAAMVDANTHPGNVQLYAKYAYHAAEALVAERERRR